MNDEHVFGEWILCKDEMPAPNRMVIVTIWGSDIITLLPGETLDDALKRVYNTIKRIDIGYFSTDDGGWCSYEGFPMITAPVAWMPLPKPYRGECNGE